MAGVPISASSGEFVAAVAATTVERPPAYPVISGEDGDTESADSDPDADSDADSDDGGNVRGRGSRRRRAPPWHRLRKDIFWKRVKTRQFWDIRDEDEFLTPMSLYFIRQCSRTSDLFDDPKKFILPGQVEEGTTNVPTQLCNTRTMMLVKLKDKKFLQAVQELQENLQSGFKIEWLTVPFSPTDPEEYEVDNEKADWARDTHKEAVRLFAKTVNKMHQVKTLVGNANADSTAATSRMYTKTQAATYMETVRKNMWILNNRFEYDRSAGGFRRIGDYRKGAIALMSSAASAAKVVGGNPNVRPRNNNNRRWQYNKRPRRDLRDAPTEKQKPHE